MADKAPTAPVAGAGKPRVAPVKAPVRKTSARRKRVPAKISFAVWSRAFLGELAATSNVSAAAAAAKVSTSLVYEMRRRNAAFNRKWQVALCEGYDLLEMELLRRMRDGDAKPAAGGARAHDNAAALRLLTAHRESAARERAIRDNDDADAILATIDAKLDRMRERALAARAERDAQDGAPDDGGAEGGDAA